CHPPARADEEAGQQQRQEHLHVDPEGEVEDCVHYRLVVDRVGEQLAVEARVAAHPQPVDHRGHDEGDEYRDVRYDERERPGVLATLEASAPGAGERAPPDDRATDVNDRCAVHGWASALTPSCTWRRSPRCA